MSGRRIVVVGATGSGKTTLARRLSQLLGVPHIEIDSLFWMPNWEMSPIETVRESISQSLGDGGWVVDGNYSETRVVTWVQADTIVWLDYPLWLILWRLFGRAIQRIVSREDLWDSGNRETWRGQFFSRDSLFLYAIKSRRKHKQYPALVNQPEYSHLTLVHLKSPREMETWLHSVAAEDG